MTQLFTVRPIQWKKTSFGQLSLGAVRQYTIRPNLSSNPNHQDCPFVVYHTGKPVTYHKSLDEAKKWVEADYLNHLANYGIIPFGENYSQESKALIGELIERLSPDMVDKNYKKPPKHFDE